MGLKPCWAFCLAVCMALVMALGHAAPHASASTAASTPSTPATPAQVDQIDQARLQQQVQELEKAMQEFKTTRAIAQGKWEATRNYVNSAMTRFLVITNLLGNQTIWIRTLMEAFDIFITVILVVAGYAAWITTKDQAKNEARAVARSWFAAKTHHLEQEIEKLLAKAEAAQESIAWQTHQVLFEAQDVSRAMQVAMAQAEAFMQSAHAKEVSGSAEQLAGGNVAAEFVRQANENLKSKAEKDFTGDEHYIRGAALYHSGNLQAALDSFDAAISHADDASSNDQVKYRMAKAFTLDALKRDEQADAIYEELDEQFGVARQKIMPSS